MKLGEFISSIGERPSPYAMRLGLSVPTITRYLKGQRGLSIHTVRVILADAGERLSLDDLVPNPYQDKGNGGKESIQK
jgi:transcriptional regulator with XRE-family HTH domain